MICASSPLLAGYCPPAGHPEHPHRIRDVQEYLERRFGEGVVTAIDRRASFEELCAVHDPAYIRYLYSVEAETYLDCETVLSGRGVDGVLRAAGICLDVMEHILDGKDAKGFALIRPPGHHAGYHRAMGYCIINNMAVAARKALQRLRRIAVVDWDAHHGNGTQELFAGTDAVLFVDIHQDNLFPPHSGGVCETGSGFTVNIPLSPGSGGARYLDVMDTAVYSALAAYKPELICVSAGFDAASGDLEANMELSPRDFGAMTERICAWADAFCGGRVFMTLEGGYRIESLSEAVGECVEVLRSWKQR